MADYQREQEELQRLYEQAVNELTCGERLVVWAGGDAPNQQNALIRAFTCRFPGVPIRLKVDLSKYHDIRVYQGLMDGCLTPDVVMLQTMNDFEDWKRMGALEPFMPQSFDSLTPGYSDPEGAFLGVLMFCFVPQYARRGLCEIPEDYTNFLAPQFRGRLVLTPPHDDAVLFVYDRMMQRYGDCILNDIAAQQPFFVRGTAAPAVLVGRSGFLGNITGYMLPPDSCEPSCSFIPKTDFFVTWPQRAAMFKLTRHKAAARLFLAYITSYEYQASRGTWSVREDVAPPEGLLPLSSYPNTNPLAFIEWMRDRARIHELRLQMRCVFGAVRGESPLSDPALLRLYGR